jgi:hypothetical protein
VYENRELRRAFGLDREEDARSWGRLRNEELRNLYASPNIVRVIKIKEVQIGGARNMHGRDDKFIHFRRKI